MIFHLGTAFVFLGRQNAFVLARSDTRCHPALVPSIQRLHMSVLKINTIFVMLEYHVNDAQKDGQADSDHCN
jgi:hypothetical protein